MVGQAFPACLIRRSGFRDRQEVCPILLWITREDYTLSVPDAIKSSHKLRSVLILISVILVLIFQRICESDYNRRTKN